MGCIAGDYSGVPFLLSPEKAGGPDFRLKEVCMRKWLFLITVVTVSFLAPACNRAVETAIDTREEEKNVRQVFDKYLQSVKTADVALASQIWLQGPNASAVTPIGRFK